MIVFLCHSPNEYHILFAVNSEALELNLKTIVQSLSLIGLAFIPLSGRVRTLYRALADVNSLCREKLYQNLGYWKVEPDSPDRPDRPDRPDSMDMAAEAMADLLARTASLSRADEALDVGFGFADFVEFARARLKDRELAERMNPLFRPMLMSSLKARRRLSSEAMDYVLVSAVKPVTPS